MIEEDLQSALPESNLLGLKGWLRLGEGLTCGGWKRWNVERGGLEYTFDLGDCSTCANST